MEYEPETYIIPANVTDNGNVLNGNIKKRNAYETAFILAVGAIICFMIGSLTSLVVGLSIYVFFILLALLAIVGIKGESLFEIIIESFFFNSKKRVMKYRLPRRDVKPKERKSFRKERKEI